MGIKQQTRYYSHVPVEPIATASPEHSIYARPHTSLAASFSFAPPTQDTNTFQLQQASWQLSSHAFRAGMNTQWGKRRGQKKEEESRTTTIRRYESSNLGLTKTKTMTKKCIKQGITARTRRPSRNAKKTFILGWGEVRCENYLWILSNTKKWSTFSGFYRALVMTYGRCAFL